MLYMPRDYPVEGLEGYTPLQQHFMGNIGAIWANFMDLVRVLT